MSERPMTDEQHEADMEARIKALEAAGGGGGDGGPAAYFWDDFVAMEDFDQDRRSFGTLAVPEGQALIEGVFTGTISGPDADAVYWQFVFLADSDDPQVSLNVTEEIRGGFTKGFSIPVAAVVPVPEGGIEFDLQWSAAFFNDAEAIIVDPDLLGASMTAFVKATLL